MIPARRRQHRADYFLLALTLVMLLSGIVMMWSASAIIAELGQRTHSQYFFLLRQALWAAIGGGLMAFFIRLDYNRLREGVWPAVGLVLLALVLALFMKPIGGSRRWIPLGFFNMQPAEFAKIAIVLFLADYVDRRRSRVGTLFHGLVLPWAVVGLALVLIALEPDLGTPALIFVAALLTLFVGGANVRHVLGAFACAFPVLGYEIFHHAYRLRRLTSFLDPFSKIDKEGYQLSQSLIAVGSGGWLGKGLGQSQLKLLYLPAPHTDFIFPIICEELGFLGGAAVICLFTWFLLRGLRAARNAPNLFGTLLAAGLSFMIALQAYFNMAMSMGLLPTKGIPLPFFSYGGSGLIASLIAAGIILNVSKQAEFDR